MLNFVLAVKAGICAVVNAATNIIRGIAVSIPNRVVDADINRFLDSLDNSRESRYSKDRSRLIAQLDGFRHEWYQFEDEWACNLCEAY